jgi:putative glutamine amidotransferase
MARISGGDEIQVNSLHGQGIDQLAPGLVVEAVAPDGTIEAVRVEGAKNFAIGVQWHPEWEVTHFPDRLRLFQAFGEACAAYRRGVRKAA